MKRSLSFSNTNVKAGVGALPVKVLSTQLLRWYDKNRRVMPWRSLPGVAPNPYHVWLSEVMLQQTTVATVGPYFQKFIKRWPELKDLARASLEDIMKMWAGLGYYRRARFLYECAQEIILNHKGRFPQSVDQLQKLPGLGPYTAAAIASIAYNQRANVVDGNVERVICRLFALRKPLAEIKPILKDCAAQLLPSSRYGDYAQALMDLGATICTPQRPKCELCPWKGSCQAYALKMTSDLPRRSKKKTKPVRRAIAFVLWGQNDTIYLQQRDMKGLLGGMMEVPSSPWKVGPMPDLPEVMDAAPLEGKWSMKSGFVRHVFSHFELQVAVAVGATRKRLIKSPHARWVARKDLDKQALPSLIRKIIQYAEDSI